MAETRRKRSRRGRGEGSIYYDEKKKLFVTQVSLGYDHRGKRIRPTVYGKTKREVQEKLAKLQQDAQDGKPIAPAKLTVAEHFTEWLATKHPPKTKPSTYEQYRYHVENHIIPGLGKIKLKDLNYRHINKFYHELDRKPNLGTRTIYDISSTLRSGLKDAAMKRIIPENPAKYAEKRPMGDKEERFLTQEEIAAFLPAAHGERLEDAFILALETGMRPGEWLGLPWDAIDWDEQTLRVYQALHEDRSGVYLGPPKTEAGKRTIDLSEEAMNALRRQRIRQKKERLAVGPKWKPPKVERPYSPDLVFTNTTGGFLIRTNVLKRDFRRVLNRAALIRLARRVGIDETELIAAYNRSGNVRIREDQEIRFEGRLYTIERGDVLDGVNLKSLRHTYVSILISMGLDLDTIARMIGHEDGSITLRKYAHMMPGRGKAAAAAVDEFMSKIRLAVNRQ